MYQVLYVDDEVDLLDIAQLYLGDSGDFSIHVSTSAEEVLESGEILSYDAIISDYQMPGMDGITFLNAVRSQFGDIPFILFTGRGREEVVIEALNAGADFYLQKGGDPEAQFTELAHKVKIAIEHRRYEGDLIRSEQRYRDVVEDQTEFISRFRPDGTHVFVNDAYCRYFGISRDEILEKKFKPQIPAEDTIKVADFFRSLTIDHPAGTIDHRILMPDGKVRWQRWNDRAIFDLSGNLLEYQSVGRDITEQKGIERALQENEEKFRDIFNNVNDGIQIHRIDAEGHPGNFIEVNDVACRMLQYSRNELLEKTPMDLVASPCTRQCAEHLEELRREGHVVFETVHARKDGTPVPVEVNAHSTTLEGKSVVVSVIRDISERKHAEQELVASEKFNREVLSHAKEGIIVYDRQLRILLWNPFMEDLTGIPAADVLGKNTVEHFPFIKKTGVADLLENALSGRTGESQDFEFSFPDTGKHGWVKGIYSPHYNTEGNIVGVIGIVRDITQRKRAEHTLMESEERFRTQYENNPLAIFTWQKKGDDFVLAGYNTEAQNLTRGRVSTLLGVSANRLYASRPEILGELWKCYTEKTTISAELISENFVPGRYIRTTGAYVPPDMVLVHMEDITAQKQHENQILQERENFFRILSAAPVGLLLVNHERVITEANRYFASIVFREPADIIGRRAGRGIGCVHSSEDPRGCGFSDSCPSCPLRNGIERVLTEGERLNGEVIDLTLQIDDTPQHRCLSVNAEPIDLDGERYSVVSVDDITLHMEYEQERIRKSEELSAAYEQIAATEEELRQNYEELANGQRLLQKNEHYLRSVVDGSPIPTFVIDRDHRITSWNHALAEYLGIPAEQVLGKPLAGQAFYKADRPSLADLIVDQAFEDIPGWYEGRFSTSSLVKGAYEVTDFFPGMKDGVWLFFTASPLYDSQGALIGAVETLQDVTGQKRAEEQLSTANEELHAAYEELAATEDELRRNLEQTRQHHSALAESEEKFRTLAESSQDYIMRYDRDCRHLYINPAALRISGLAENQIMGKTHKEAGFNEDLSRMWEENIRKVVSTGTPVEVQFEWENPGGRVVLDYHLTPEFDEEGMVKSVIGVSRDITRLKDAEAALRESEAKFSTVFFTNPVSLSLVSSREGTFVDVNDAFLRNTGYTREEVLGKTSAELGLFPDPEEYRQMVSDLQNQRVIHGMELHVRTKQGRVQVCRFSSAIILMSGVPHILSTVEDITGQKNAQDALKESEERFRSLVNELHDGVIILGFDGLVRFGNPAAFRMVGLDPSGEDLPVSMIPYIDPDSIPQVIADLQAIREQGRGFLSKYRLVTASGEKRWVEASGTRVMYQGSPADLVAIRDITEREEAERALSTANKKLHLLGSITRHDLRNKLTVSLGYILMIKKKSTEPIVQEYIAKLESAAMAIGSQIEFTRVYQDLGTHEPRWQDLDAMLPRSQVPETILLHADVPGLEIYTDPLIEKVFFNLLDNSIRHGEHVGEISVRAIPSEERLTIVWEDNGIGIPAEEKERIFDQDFGKNTGLGMFLSREILSLTGITIRESGVYGEGARFEITVPKGAWRMTKKPDTPGQTP